MQRAPSKCNSAQTEHSRQNGTYLTTAPNVYEYSIPVTMNNWNTVPRPPAETDCCRLVVEDCRGFPDFRIGRVQWLGTGEKQLGVV